MKERLASLWSGLTPLRRRSAIWTVVAVVGAASAEFLSLFALKHFLDLLFKPPVQPSAYVAAVLFVLSAFVVMVARMVAIRVQDRFVLGTAKDISVGIFERAVHQPYLDHVNRNSGALFEVFSSMPRLVGGILTPMVQAISAATILTGILLCLFILVPFIIFPLLLTVGVCYWSIARRARKRLREGSRTVHSVAVERMKLVNEAQRGFRELTLGHYQREMVQQLDTMERSFQAKIEESRFASSAPRFIVELVVILIFAAFVCYWVSLKGQMGHILPLIGLLSMAIQRSVPLFNSCYYGWSEFQANHALLDNVLGMLSKPSPPRDAGNQPALPFNHAIELKDIGLSYNGKSRVLKDLNLVVGKGARIGIMGVSGSGKSSLLDILLGLIEPTGGQLLVDGVAVDTPALRAGWQKQLACVSQHVYLRDDSIRNVVANPSEAEPFDNERFARALRQAQLEELVANLPEGTETRVGDGGGLLSGGQQQRLAIARALYAQSKVLVLDEATSQLDAETEAEIVATLDTIDRSVTVVIVAHRIASLKSCDRIYTLQGGQLKDQTELRRSA